MTRDPARLAVFHIAHQLTLQTYRLTQALPPSERFGLQAQMRRAAVSIPANIVEGSAREGARDYARFLEIALGSAVELRYLLSLAIDLHYLTPETVGDCRDCVDHVVRALNKLHRAAASFVPDARRTTSWRTGG